MNKYQQTRRSLLAIGGAACVLPRFAWAQSEPPKPPQIVVNDSGGDMQNAMRQAFYNEYEKRYGIKVVSTSPVDLGKLRAMVQSGRRVAGHRDRRRERAARRTVRPARAARSEDHRPFAVPEALAKSQIRVSQRRLFDRDGLSDGRVSGRQAPAELG